MGWGDRRDLVFAQAGELQGCEAAKLLWVCWKTREWQGDKPTDKFPLRHLCRVILMGIPLGLVLLIGLKLSFSKSMTIKGDTPISIVLVLCTNRLLGAIFISAVLIAAYI